MTPWHAELDSLRPVLDELIRPVVASGSIPFVPVAAGNARTGERVTVCEVPPDGEPHPGPALFDLASLSKVEGTLPVVLELVREAEVGLDDPMSRYLGAAAAGAAGVTVRQLLAHTSGLPVTRRYYREVRDADQLREAVLAESPEVRPGTRTLYAAIGFLLLGFLVEEVSRSTLDALARQLVFDPLQLPELTYRPDAALVGRCVPMEIIDLAPVVGVVHDRNAGRWVVWPGTPGCSARSPPSATTHPGGRIRTARGWRANVVRRWPGRRPHRGPPKAWAGCSTTTTRTS